MGIDPGTMIAGYGVVDAESGNYNMIVCGVIKAPQKLAPAERLSIMYKGLLKILKEYKPDVMAVEHPFVGANVSSALAIGRAQAVAMLIAANNDIPVYEYSPAKIKQSVASYGASSKEQVQQMVKIHLNLLQVPEPFDAADALAVALCHINENHINILLEEKPVKKRRTR
ncbi:MAG: crossover junction endodeoxyribonuclease RuvC [Dehalococcoidales bacterium]|nr:crossover junction endodeoxyribonuclease RuvC [Dehalococcoidales bacterium]